MQKISLVAALAVVWLTGACEKTRQGEYEVQKPVIGTTTDTIHTPTVETGTAKDTIEVPDVDVKTEKKEVTVPKVKIHKPGE